MSSRLISKLRKAALAASAASLLGAPQAGAQDEKKTDEPAKADEPAQEEKQEQAPPQEAREGTLKQPEGPLAPGEGIYVIQKGDTLWDLSNKFLTSPWYWPKIWTTNPYIENPHWIYPGNKLRIKNGKGGVASVQPVEEGQPGQEQAQEEAREEESPPSMPTKTKVETPDFAILKQGSHELEDASVSATGRLAFIPPTSLSIKPRGIISTEEADAAGRIDGSFEEKELLTLRDTAYVKFKSPDSARVGAKYTIFRKRGEIVHPLTGKPAGHRIIALGEGKVISVQGEIATLLITGASEEIERGDMVGTLIRNDVQRVAQRPNARSVDAVILAAENNDLSTFGQNSQVFIDKGKDDGVEVGNTFVVRRHGDGLGGIGGPSAGSYLSTGPAATAQTPDENVGLLMVIDVKDKVSTAMVLKSIRELRPGEPAEMRPTQAGSGGY